MRLDELASYYFVDEIKFIGNNYDRYKYRLSEVRGERMANRVKTKFKDCYEEIESLVTKCNELCELKTTPLSYAAKIHHTLTNTTEYTNIDDLKKRWKEFGWKLNDKDTDQGTSLLEKLLLVPINQLECGSE